MPYDVTTVTQRIKLNGKRYDKKEKSNRADKERKRGETCSKTVPD